MSDILTPSPIKRNYGSQYIFAYQDSISAGELKKQQRPCLSCDRYVKITPYTISCIKNGIPFEIKLKSAQDYLPIHQRTVDTITDDNKRKANSDNDDVPAEKKLKRVSTPDNDNKPRIQFYWDDDKTYLLPAQCKNKACPSTAIAVFYGYEITADGGYSYCPHKEYEKKYYTKDIYKFMSHLIDRNKINCMYCLAHMPHLKGYVDHINDNLCDKYKIQPMETLYSICEEPDCKEKILIPLTLSSRSMYEYTVLKNRHDKEVHRICEIKDNLEEKNKISECNEVTNQIIAEKSKIEANNSSILLQEEASNNNHSLKLEYHPTDMYPKKEVIINITNLNIDQQEILTKLGFQILFEENERYAITEVTNLTNQSSAEHDLALLDNPIVIDVSNLTLEQLKIIDSIAEIDRYESPSVVEISQFIRLSSPVIVPENLSIDTVATNIQDTTPSVKDNEISQQPQADLVFSQNSQDQELVDQSVSMSLAPDSFLLDMIPSTSGAVVNIPQNSQIPGWVIAQLSKK